MTAFMLLGIGYILFAGLDMVIKELQRIASSLEVLADHVRSK